MTSVSVIIPTFNRAKSLLLAIQSVYQQTYPINEIIIIDDSSSDNTQALVKQHYPQAIYIYQQNAGVSVARNTGIRYAKSEWFAFLDSDDQWLTDKINTQLSALKNTQYRFCHCDEIWIRHGKRVNPMKKHQKQGGFIYPECLPLCCISPSATVIHHSVFDELGYFDPELIVCEDYDYWLRFCSIYPVLYIDQELLVKYGGHDDQLSRQYWGMDRFRIQSLLNQLYLNKLNPEQQQQTIDQLIKKITIYCKGAKKRQKHEELQYYQQILDHYHGCIKT